MGWLMWGDGLEKRECGNGGKHGCDATCPTSCVLQVAYYQLNTCNRTSNRPSNWPCSRTGSFGSKFIMSLLY